VWFEVGLVEVVGVLNMQITDSPRLVVSTCGLNRPVSCGFQPATSIGVSRMFHFNSFSNGLYEKELKRNMLKVQTFT